ncbi:N-acetylmuramoyl-L-alanine amidase family protein [Heyndrickxia acidicola]|uniref:N-acetylmuramoyl-L-alanine amidase n=1 Tax=Heyndrickxia acidicola TaxID=209389 RepID=A0ABU6MGF5_9BACI|nr:N-acetylmuramoyl-L-alanine amidase [Heyndrickxia acidicola]MED1203761.1 N-acetylmuramoyl-L-alanine amidase [Heyndrickxia acidicola]
MKIVLDAGHGPDTPGKRSPNGLKEFSFTSAATDYTREILETYQNVSVYFAHSKKEDVPLSKRTNLANRLGANCYISIHANAAGDGKDWNQANGIETFVYLSKPKEALSLASAIQHCIIQASGLADRGVKRADFHVLRETNMTAVLVECGFYTNKKEEALLCSPSYQKLCAKAIADGVAQVYFLKPR